MEFAPVHFTTIWMLVITGTLPFTTKHVLLSRRVVLSKRGSYYCSGCTPVVIRGHACMSKDEVIMHWCVRNLSYRVQRAADQSYSNELIVVKNSTAYSRLPCGTMYANVC